LLAGYCLPRVLLFENKKGLNVLGICPHDRETVTSSFTLNMVLLLRVVARTMDVFDRVTVESGRNGLESVSKNS
jgi:hypothetical protein